MVSMIRAQILAALEGLQADGRYLLDESGFSSAWRTSPDPGVEMSPYDLTATVRIGGPRYTGRATLRYPVGVGITLAAYSGTRTPTDSEMDLTAEDRIHAAAEHVASILSRLPISGGLLSRIGWTDPTLDTAGMWWDSTVQFFLTLSTTSE